MNAIPTGRYRHYKGRDYEVLSMARHSETGEDLVVYRALYGDYGTWVRPASMFTEMVTVDGVEAPRFVWIGPSDVHRLGPDALRRARAWISANGRPLENALLAWHFDGGHDEAVLDQLARFHNGDGGYGHGLEPDLRTPDSSALATSIAFQILLRLDVPVENTLVREAVRYLTNTFNATTATWPLIPASANDAPHAPWWTYGPDHHTWFGDYLVNARAELVGALYHYRALIDEGWLSPIAESLKRHFDTREKPLDMHELLSALRLARTEGTPSDLRESALRAIERSMPVALATTSDQWEGYSLQPLSLAPDPRSPLAPALLTLIDANLDFRIDEQESDGAWSTSWSWGDLFSEEWQAARRDWQGVLTLDSLRQLAAWERIAR